MFGDLLTIYRRNKLKNCFRDYKIKTRKLININPDADKKIKKFFEKQYYLIYKGENIQKINYSTSGIKTHFYQIDYENDLFESFSTDPNTNKPEKTYDFDDVLKILVGFKTKNINSKLDELNIPKKLKASNLSNEIEKNNEKLKESYAKLNKITRFTNESKDIIII